MSENLRMRIQKYRQIQQKGYPFDTRSSHEDTFSQKSDLISIEPIPPSRLRISLHWKEMENASHTWQKCGYSRTLAYSFRALLSYHDYGIRSWSQLQIRENFTIWRVLFSHSTKSEEMRDSIEMPRFMQYENNWQSSFVLVCVGATHSECAWILSQSYSDWQQCEHIHYVHERNI